MSPLKDLRYKFEKMYKCWNLILLLPNGQGSPELSDDKISRPQPSGQNKNVRDHIVFSHEMCIRKCCINWHNWWLPSQWGVVMSIFAAAPLPQPLLKQLPFLIPPCLTSVLQVYTQLLPTLISLRHSQLILLLCFDASKLQQPMKGKSKINTKGKDVPRKHKNPIYWLNS